VNLELQAPFVAKRIRAICDERQLTIEQGQFQIWNLRGRAADASKLLPTIIRQIKPGEYILVVIDPVYKMLGDRDENKTGDIASLLNEIESLAVQTGAAVAFGAHYSKGGQASKEPIDRVSGSGVFARDPDTILNFTRHVAENCFTVDAILRNHPPIEPFVVRWEFPLFVLADELDPEHLKKPGGAPRKVKDDELLELFTEGARGSQVVKTAMGKFDCGERAVYDGLKRLREAGRLILKEGDTNAHRKTEHEDPKETFDSWYTAKYFTKPMASATK
jgi:hypothetical protein